MNLGVLQNSSAVNAHTVQMIRRSRRSWWRAMYRTGKVLAEWQTLRGVGIALAREAGKTSRWEEIEKKDMTGLQLLCPDGKAVCLEAPEGHKFFQLKVGGMRGAQQFCAAHIIGVVENERGDCRCWAWDTSLGQAVQFTDNVRFFRRYGIGPLNLGLQDLRI